MIFNQKLITDIILINIFLFFSRPKFNAVVFLSKSTILRPRAQYGQYLTLHGPSDCRYFVRQQ